MLPQPPLRKDFTPNQLRIYNQSFSTKRMLVTGEPGTGKSTLIGLSIRDYKKESESEGRTANVELVAYNKNLANFNGQLYQIESKTYLKTLNEYVWFAKGGDWWGEFFKLKPEEQNSKIRSCPVKSGRRPGSFLCIDEGQDLLPAAFEKFAEIFENVYVFMDDGQTLNGKGGSTPKSDVARILAVPMTDTHYLTENFRNTKEIHDAFHRLRQASTGEDTVAAEKHGRKPIRYSVPADEQLDRIVEICKQQKPSKLWNIGIIAKTKIDQERIRGALQNAGITGVQACMTDKEPIDYRNNTIFVLNTMNVKGLEFHEVVLFDVSEEWKGSNQLYVSATRASELLHAFFHDDSTFDALGLRFEDFEDGNTKQAPTHSDYEF